LATRSVDFLLIGGGLAAANCARWLREEGAEGSVLLVGREPHPPYNRPPLSKGYLQGKDSIDDDVHFRHDDWWEEQSIELMTRTSVMKLDTGSRTATLSNKEEIEFDKALLATGSNVRRLKVEGGDLDRIHYLRTVGNSEAIRDDAASAERVVLIGGSYIGTEVAASLTAAYGKQCSILMLEDVTLERFYGQEVGGFFQRALEEHGVEVHGGQSVARFEGADGHVRKVVTESGLELDCDMVVIGAGVHPDVTLARAAGLELGEAGGVKCSAGLETSVPGIFAAGDICEYDSVIHGKPMRIEHWDVAFNQGKTAALNMLGRGIDHDVMPYFFSDLADWTSMEYVGPGSGDTVIRGSIDDGDFTAFYVDPESGKVTAALTVGRSDDLEHAKRFITGGASPDRAALADESTDLASL
jgi:3-phenylpropionate/trans-cinnamate dioxygenase ferredoxin reductase component